MIEFDNLSKSYRTDGGARKFVLRPCTFKFPSNQVVGILGRNGAGKSTLLRIIAGIQDPDGGRVIRHGSVSFPIGFSGSFHQDLTGAQNTRFVARIYGADTDALLAYVDDFTELGDFLHMPVRTYSSGMKSRLSFAVSMGLPFDVYLVDEVTSVGDARFKKKAAAVFRHKIRGSTAFMVSHSLNQVRQLCSAAVVLEQGNLTFFDDVEAAIFQHERNMLKS
ncbi:MAG: ABC transporter ATP-binding protein [Pseudomonadota bacterium]